MHQLSCYSHFLTPSPKPTWQVNPSSGRVSDQRRLLDRQVVEFPVVSPAVVGKRHAYAYCVGDVVRDDVLWGPFQV